MTTAFSRRSTARSCCRLPTEPGTAPIPTRRRWPIWRRRKSPSSICHRIKAVTPPDSIAAPVKAWLAQVDAQTAMVKTIIGEGLFTFGDEDGPVDRARLQHALGLTWAAGKLFVADTYNSKLKVIDAERKSCKTYLGGESDGWLAGHLRVRLARCDHHRPPRRRSSPRCHLAELRGLS